MASIPVITIDGPSAAGKGAVSLLTARALRWHILPSGFLYRCLAYLASAAGSAEERLEDQAGTIVALIPSLQPRFVAGQRDDETLHVFLQNQDITSTVMQDTIGELAGKISALAEVRAPLVETQRSFRRAPGLVAEGRDMGTKIFPDASLKIFLTADVQVRAARRLKQLKNYGATCATIEGVLDAIQKRDARDLRRVASPLKKAEDAVRLDTTHKDAAQIARQIVKLVEARI